MSILQYNGFPTEYKGYELSTDFRNMINADLIISDTSLNPFRRNLLMLDQLYPVMPDDIRLAQEGFLWFFSRGESEKDTGKNISHHRAKKSYDFEQDADYIYASFCAAYGIRLSEVRYMHWWEFMALFNGLPENTLIQRIRYYRTCDESKLSKQERKHVLHMRKQFALKHPDSKSLENMTLEDLQAKTIEYYDNRARGDR